MADQIVDKRTVGIPSDIELVRHETEGFMTSASESASRAQDERYSAQISASEAAGSAEFAHTEAERAKELVEAKHRGISIDHTAPPQPSDGQVWFESDAGETQITGVHRWDAGAAGSALWPSTSLYPSQSLYPQGQGEWHSYKLSTDLTAI